LFIKHGLLRHCWVGTESQFIVNQGDWDLSGFGGPTFFRTPLLNPSFMENNPQSQWSIAKAPYAANISRGPNEEEEINGFLTQEQKQYLDNLTTICFGDEEAFSSNLVVNLRSWFDLSRKLYLDVMVHSNQWGNQWSESELQVYVAVAQPDLITFDAYLFDSNNPENYRGSKEMGNYLMKYRNIALEGIDGTGEYPIGFGQYIQGYIKNNYKLTESQLRLYYFMTWTFGGKWLNWFRYLQEDGFGNNTQPGEYCLLLENGVPGNPTEVMYWTNNCNAESNNLSPYLSRLQSTAVACVKGSSGASGQLADNVPEWSAQMDSCIKSVNGELLGNEFTGSAGDIYIGYFKVIPLEQSGDPGFFENPQAEFFMILNAFTTRNVGSAYEARQKISVNMVIEANSGKSVKKINRENGLVETVELIPNNDGTYSFSIILPGGTADLFYID
jgi:hypothetical protein